MTTYINTFNQIMNEIDFKKINDDILNKADIVSIISNYVSLEKKGNNYIGLCPFHQDNTPSFTVSPSKKIYKCFACSESGNVITFIKNHLGKNYLETLDYFSKELSLDFDLSQMNKKVETRSEEELEILEVLKITNSFYKVKVFNNKDAQEYLKKRNLLDSELRKTFNIGFAPGNELYKYLSESSKFSDDVIYKSGLITSDFKELFWNRITFGIKNSQGEIVGFSARALNNEIKPKYINSPETRLFNKSKILYNYDNARNSIEKNKEVYIVEGFMDVIALYKAGIENAVALMGTALTNDHVRLINKYSVILFLDKDSAGISATIKSIKTLLANNVSNIFVSVNSFEKDADEILEKEGKEALFYTLNNRKSFIDFIYDFYTNTHNLKTDFNYINIKKFENDLSSFLSLLDYDQKFYIFNKFKSDFGYDLSSLSNSSNQQNAQKLSDVKQFINTNFEEYYDNHLNINKNIFTYKDFTDLIATNIRIKFLMYFILKPDFAKRFYSLDNSKILYSKPTQLEKVYEDIKDKSFGYFDLLGHQKEPTVKEAIIKIKKDMHTRIFELIASIKKEVNDQELRDFYVRYINDINKTINDNGQISLNPIVQELIDAYKEENERLKITPNPKQNSYLMKELKRFKNKKI
ncbi:DNA primase [Mycoplasmopsis canis]|nr:DNA primase [Mycoplasmopsis canis]